MQNQQTTSTMIEIQGKNKSTIGIGLETPSGRDRRDGRDTPSGRDRRDTPSGRDRCGTPSNRVLPDGFTNYGKI
jgi:hypothetical protein